MPNHAAHRARAVRPQKVLAPAPPRTWPSTSRTAGQARAYARKIVEQATPGITEERLADVELIVSELVINACRYGAEPGDLAAVAV
ncbi:ATP-binding protein [Streptomyces sp. NPDC018019]|uniref:ATP-binding protein n=1 Tax=Streptomyces sp. NPDC018019 TaxID=3365030 RepID=UPI0037A128C4